MKKEQLLKVKKMLIILGLATPGLLLSLSNEETNNNYENVTIEKDADQEQDQDTIYYHEDENKAIYTNLAYIREKDSESFENNHPDYQKIDMLESYPSNSEDGIVYLYGIRTDNKAIDEYSFVTYESNNTIDAKYKVYENTKTKQKIMF